MRILVTGCNGYIGTAMVPMLLEGGQEVVGLDSDLYRECTYFGPLPDVPLVEKDVRDVTRQDLGGFDAVVHLAALSNDPLGNLDPEVTCEINHRGSVHLARLARDAGIERFVFSSSCSVYGASDDSILTEESETRPVTPYARSKLLAEREILELSNGIFHPTILRSATAYGASPRLRFDLVLNNLTAWAFTTGKVMLKSDGSPWRPVVHIEDISRAFISVLGADDDAVSGQVFNVGRTEENYRIRDLARIVKETVPGSELSFAREAGPDSRCYKVDCSKLPAVVPGFRPSWDARRGAEQLHATFKVHGLTLDEFEGPRYRRVDHLMKLLESGALDPTFRRLTRESPGEEDCTKPSPPAEAAATGDSDR